MCNAQLFMKEYRWIFYMNIAMYERKKCLVSLCAKLVLLRDTRHQPANVFPSLPNYPIICGPGLDLSFVRDISSFQVSCWFILTKSM